MNDNNAIRVQISVDGIPALTDAINRLITAMCGATGASQIPAQQQPVQPTPVQAPQATTTEPVQTPPATQTASPSMMPTPVQTAPATQQTPVQQTQVPSPVPTSAVVNTYTRDQLAVAASGLINMGKQQRLLEILHGFGVQALTELPENLYGAFAGAIKVEGAVL